MHRIISIALLLSLVLGFQAFSFGEEVSTPQDSQPLEVEAPKIVKLIEVKGNKAVSSNVVLSKMKTRVGSPYQENVTSDDLKRLYLLGFFSDIKIDTEDYKDGIKLIVTVTERPLISKITFSGMVRIATKDEKLKESLKSKEGQYLDYPTLTEDAKTLKKMYDKIGYSNAEVTHKVNVDEKTYKANVGFNVVEGSRIKIKKIYVQGNKSFSALRILKLLKTKPAWLFNAGTLKEEVLSEDIERVKSFYRREGFADVAADYEITTGNKKLNLLYITIKIQEGRKYLVGTVTITGNNDIKEKEILSKLSECTPGKVFSQDAMRVDIANIQALYFDRGYIMMQIQETASLNSLTGRTDITYNITEHDIAYVDKIKVRGNVKTKDTVVRRELRIRPGDKFDGEKLRRSKERLQNLGFFEEISYDTEDTPVPDRKDLVVEVKETKTGTFSFGGGYSTVDQFVGFVEIEQKNFDWRNFPYFTGAGQNLKFRASVGSITNDFDLSFTEPWLFDYPVAFGFDGYKREHKRDTDVGYGYDEKITGGDIRLGREISEYVTASMTYRYDQIEISNISDNASNDLKSEYGTNNISSVSLGAAFDSRDNIFDTTKGNFLNATAECAGGFLSGDKNFYKFSGRASHYFPMPAKSVFEVRGRVGIAKNYGDSDSVPIYERFFVGGAYTVRGYEERKIGPVDPDSKDPLGGQSMIVGNLEYTYPLFNFMKVAAFFDVGNAWAQLRDTGSDGFKSGVGIGVRLKTPIGPITLDYGIPLNKESGEDTRKSGRLHFSASQGF